MYLQGSPGNGLGHQLPAPWGQGREGSKSLTETLEWKHAWSPLPCTPTSRGFAGQCGLLLHRLSPPMWRGQDGGREDKGKSRVCRASSLQVPGPALSSGFHGSLLALTYWDFLLYFQSGHPWAKSSLPCSEPLGRPCMALAWSCGQQEQHCPPCPLPLGSEPRRD